MEPVITKSPYHHVLLMRDDKEVVSFKVHSKVLWYSILATVLLLAFGLAGTFYGFKVWQKNRNLRAKYTAASTELKEARFQLEQLNNLRSLISTSDLPAPVFTIHDVQLPVSPIESNNGTGEGASDTADTNAATRNSNGNESISPAAHAESSSSTMSEGAATEDSPQSSSATEETSQKATNETAHEGTEGAVEASETQNGATAPSIDDAQSPIRINNMTSKYGKQDRIEIRFDLLAAKNDTFIRGLTSYEIVLHDGARHTLTPNFLDDTKFAIRRMKNFDLTATLPQGVAIDSIKEVIILVTLESGETFASPYPFGQ